MNHIEDIEAASVNLREIINRSPMNRLAREYILDQIREIELRAKESVTEYVLTRQTKTELQE